MKQGKPGVAGCRWQSAPPGWGCSWRRPGRGRTCHWCWTQGQRTQLCLTGTTAGTARGPAALWPVAPPVPPWTGRTKGAAGWLRSKNYCMQGRIKCRWQFYYLSASTFNWVSLLILTSSPGPASAFWGSVVKPVTHPEMANNTFEFTF